ncbi:DNA replication and repair protein RecF [Candidatus Woesebacteria bacterium]|jgi:DNA replication and repair protein RecF|nr:DNA replication and repair protein RecF [Candidatus Woesebacteria bacterium]
MILTSITLSNFRSYKKKTFTLSGGATLIVGENAVGKTNILESIMLLATGKSFRADKDNEMIYWGNEMAHITGHIAPDTRLEVQITHGALGGHTVPKKRLLVNGVPRRSIDFVGNCRAVLFWPQDLELITDSPSLRRKYLDTVLMQVDREYRRNLVSYERGLRQRNKLLDLIKEGVATRSQLLFWNQLLIKSGGYITNKRSEFIDYLQAFEISGIRHTITYDKSVISETRLEQYRDEEVAAKATLVGPHRDDFIVSKMQQKRAVDAEHADWTELSKYGSRGEQRLGVLWLKLGELSYVEHSVGNRPMLLLDDIFSELDEKHRAIVFDVTKKQQTIITSAEADIVDELGAKEVSVIAL